MAGAAAMPEEDLVRLYLNDVGRHPLLTKADEGVLGRLVAAIGGGEEEGVGHGEGGAAQGIQAAP